MEKFTRSNFDIDEVTMLLLGYKPLSKLTNQNFSPTVCYIRQSYHSVLLVQELFLLEQINLTC